GALNSIEKVEHRRTALWQVEAALRSPGNLFKEIDIEGGNCPLPTMTPEERLSADLRNTGINIGKHPMSYLREYVDSLGVTRSTELQFVRNNEKVKIAGAVIVRQRPGTAKGFVFISMEDEFGVMNVIVTPDFFRQNHQDLVGYPYLIVEGILQNYDNTVSVKAAKVTPLMSTSPSKSRNFH